MLSGYESSLYVCKRNPHCICPGPRAGNKKLDDLREKYQKASRKLHQIHNEYVLLLAEATEFERDYRTVIFPGACEFFFFSGVANELFCVKVF